MNYLLNLKPLALSKKIDSPKAQTGTDAGWMVVCEVALLSKKANP